MTFCTNGISLLLLKPLLAPSPPPLLLHFLDFPFAVRGFYSMKPIVLRWLTLGLGTLLRRYQPSLSTCFW